MVGVSILRLAIVTILTSFICLAGTAQAQTRACDQRRDPHSFACQHDTFSGHIFPLVPAHQNRVVGSWRTLVYTPAPGQAPVFRNLVSPQNPRIPMGLRNPDGSVVGRFQWPHSGSLTMGNFVGANNTIVQVSAIRAVDMTTQVIMDNRGQRTREAFACRIFIRNRAEHLLCQWQRDAGRGFVFMGYFGFVR